MQITLFSRMLFLVTLAAIVFPGDLQAQEMLPSSFSFHSKGTFITLMALAASCLFFAVWFLKCKVKGIINEYRIRKNEKTDTRNKAHIDNLSSNQIESILKYKKRTMGQKKFPGGLVMIPPVFIFLSLALFSSSPVIAQTEAKTASGSLFSNTGIVITVVLLLLPILAGVVILIINVVNLITKHKNAVNREEARQLATYLSSLSEEEVETVLKERKAALDYSLHHNELSGSQKAVDEKGLLNINTYFGLPVVALKKKALKRPNIDPALSKLIIWYLGCATFWLLFGTTVGEYLGIKFVAPDADHLSWLSFGRLRPVHTNAVFWGWASLGMLGLGYYVVPMVSNTNLASIKKGWYALILINAAVIAGTLCLMAGINNGGGEYREYIWPVMLLFGMGLILTLINFLQTIAKRSTKEIYIANWYIVASIIFAIVISIVAYIPNWQNGLGETIIQGYYMHQGVGMWFMLFTLGIVYYFLPQQLNKPIYSYSLGILAFWTQILFYTLIGTHHFVFSSIPWWLQTVAIVGSAGMIIPVVAGTTNFIMTFKGAWYKIKDSYTLPFFLIGIIFYFTGSLQGTAEAFRSTNLIWHFTDFTVAHSHLTMYGIICFFLWAVIYAILPRLTGREAPQITIGAHFWLALIGLLFYTIPLMYGSTLKGLLWIEKKPFVDGLVLMAPYWLWRAIGGSLMWLSHLFFAYNMYKMLANNSMIDVKETAINLLKKDPASIENTL
ncbi:MAG: cbb3-type cytochrome c oxidase subunit I [Bacteroidota bacterium]